MYDDPAYLNVKYQILKEHLEQEEKKDFVGETQ